MEKIELFENEKAERYENFVDTWIPGYHGFMESLPALLHDTTDKNALIVGCGTGNEMKCFANSADGWKITGVDPSPQMISQARKKLANHEGIKFIEGLVSDLPTNEKYGVATLLLVLHFMQDNGEKLALLKNIAERLQPNASFVILDITGDDAHIDANLDVLCRMLSQKGIPSEEVEKRRHRIKNGLHPLSESRLPELIAEAGFSNPVKFFQNSIHMGWLMQKK